MGYFTDKVLQSLIKQLQNHITTIDHELLLQKERMDNIEDQLSSILEK